MFSFLISIRILKLLLSGLIKFPTWVILAFILFPRDGKNNSTLVTTLTVTGLDSGARLTVPVTITKTAI